MPFPNDKTKFKKGESGNPNGRPPKLLTQIVADLKAKGYERATSSTVLEAFEVLMNLPENEVIALTSQPDTPISLLVVGRAITDKNNGWDVLQGILDRAHGKPKQAVDLSASVRQVTAPIIKLNPPNE